MNPRLRVTAKKNYKINKNINGCSQRGDDLFHFNKKPDSTNGELTESHLSIKNPNDKGFPQSN